MTFRSAASVYAVCEHCGSTLLASDDVLENLGRMAELLPDPSLVQLGTTGRHRALAFTVLGRIQMTYERGLWNEWYVLFDNGRPGWLGEAQGQWTMTFDTTPAATDRREPGAPLPAFDTLQAGATVALHGEAFVVTDLERARCVAAQGELPHAIRPGYDAPLADLRSAQRFATIDYSDDPPRVFVGEIVDRAALALAGLREPDAAPPPARTGARTLECPSCGMPLRLFAPGRTRTLACSQCGAVLDPADPKATLLEKAAGRLALMPRIPLGAAGDLDGRRWRVIGYLQRSCPDDPGSRWGEYLLFDDADAFTWLVEASDHWTLCDAKPVRQIPATRGRVTRFDGTAYRHYATYEAVVDSVVGEFTWQVRQGDRVVVEDYVAPPRSLSVERTPDEMTATAGTWIAPQAVTDAFRLDPPLPSGRGIAPNQPSPWRGRLRPLLAACVAVSAVGCVEQGAFWAMASTPLAPIRLAVPGDATQASVSSAPFHLDASRALRLGSRGDLQQDWAELDVDLVNVDTGQVFNDVHELSRYSGIEDGERWSEDASSQAAVFHDVPAGTYRLVVDVTRGRSAGGAALSRLAFSFRRNPATWSNWLLLQLGLLLPPGFFWLSALHFESQRWAGSDHGSASAGDDGDDGGGDD